MLVLTQDLAAALPVTFAVRGAVGHDGRYVLFDEADLILLDQSGEWEYVSAQSLREPKGVRLLSNGLIEVLDGGRPALIRMTTTGAEQAIHGVELPFSVNDAVPVSTGWVVSGRDSVGGFHLGFIDENDGWSAQSCGMNVEVDLFSARGDALVIPVTPPFDGILIEGDKRKCRPMLLEFPSFSQSPGIRVAAMTMIGSYLLSLVVDTQSEYREFFLFDSNGTLLRRKAAASVGILLALPNGTALGYRQIPFPEVVFYRYTLNP